MLSRPLRHRRCTIGAAVDGLSVSVVVAVGAFPRPLDRRGATGELALSATDGSRFRDGGLAAGCGSERFVVWVVALLAV